MDVSPLNQPPPDDPPRGGLDRRRLLALGGSVLAAGAGASLLGACSVTGATKVGTLGDPDRAAITVWS
ncbi:hypothetical protein ACFVYF_17175 [Streptomyces sp. NPDC058274]|uniref:hypothetical protein n=1 Tax=Streptomyces sp. NPDC058274 TaxID=3346416 RepID=UPI0036E9B43A